jgi:uncharacterized protein
VLVLADTHLTGDGLDRLPSTVWRALDRATAVLHAGDVTEAELLHRLGSSVPVHAVLGNNDHQLDGQLPERLELAIGGHRIAMVHDSGARVGRELRLRRWFPHAALVVFGHSHLPLNAPSGHGQLLFNPGSPTQRRRAPQATFGWITIGARGVRAEILPV